MHVAIVWFACCIIIPLPKFNYLTMLKWNKCVSLLDLTSMASVFFCVLCVQPRNVFARLSVFKVWFIKISFFVVLSRSKKKNLWKLSGDDLAFWHFPRQTFWGVTYSIWSFCIYLNMSSESPLLPSRLTHVNYKLNYNYCECCDSVNFIF